MGPSNGNGDQSVFAIVVTSQGEVYTHHRLQDCRGRFLHPSARSEGIERKKGMGELIEKKRESWQLDSNGKVSHRKAIFFRNHALSALFCRFFALNSAKKRGRLATLFRASEALAGVCRRLLK